MSIFQGVNLGMVSSPRSAAPHPIAHLHDLSSSPLESVDTCQGMNPSDLRLTEEIRPTTVWMYKHLVNNGLNYQPQLVSRISEPPTVSGFRYIIWNQPKQCTIYKGNPLDPWKSCRWCDFTEDIPCRIPPFPWKNTTDLHYCIPSPPKKSGEFIDPGLATIRSPSARRV